MSTTKTNLRKGMMEEIGERWASTATGGTTVTVVDATQADLIDEPSSNQWVLMTGGTYDTVARRIASYSAGTTTVNRSFGGSIVSTDTYEKLPFKPSLITDALNNARITAYPHVYRYLDLSSRTFAENQHEYGIPTAIEHVKQVYLESFVGGDVEENLLTNGDFEDTSGTFPTGWDTPTNITASSETDEDFVLEGDTACQCLGTTSAGSMYQSMTTYANYAGMRMSLRLYVYCETADHVEASIYDSAATTGTAHTGKGWEWISVSYDMPASPSALKAGWTTEAGTAVTFYVKHAILTIGRRPVKGSSQLLRNWRQHDRVIEFPSSWSAGSQIRMIGTGFLSSISAETDEMEVDYPQTEILYADAILYLLRQGVYRGPAQSQDGLIKSIGFWEGEAHRRRQRHGMGFIATNRSDF